MSYYPSNVFITGGSAMSLLTFLTLVGLGIARFRGHVRARGCFITIYGELWPEFKRCKQLAPRLQLRMRGGSSVFGVEG